MGLLKPPLANGGRTGEGAFLVAEKFRFNQVAGNGGHVQRDKGAVIPGAVIMQGARHQFLTRAALTVDEHRYIGMGQPANGPENLLHGGGFPNDLRILAPGFHVGCPAGGATLAAVFNGAAEQFQGLVHVKGFGQVLEGARLIGRDGAVQIRVGGHDDNRHIRVILPDGFEKTDAVNAGHSDVADDRIRDFCFQARQHAFPGLETDGGHAGLGQRTVENPADAPVVVDDPDSRVLSHSEDSSGRKMIKRVWPGLLSHSTRP